MDANSDDPNFGNDIHDDPDFGDPNFDFAAFDHDPRDEVVQFMLGYTGTTSVEALVDLLRTQQLTSEQEAAERRAEVAARRSSQRSPLLVAWDALRLGNTRNSTRGAGTAGHFHFLSQATVAVAKLCV